MITDPESMNFWVDLSNIIKNSVLTLATLIGGFWAIFQFGIFRRLNENLSLTHSVSITYMPNGQLFVRLEVRIENISKVLIEIDHGGVYAQKILPCDPSVLASISAESKDSKRNQYPKLDWPIHGDRLEVEDWGIILEPGESEVVNFDYLFTDSIEKFTLYSYFVSKRMIKKQPLLPWTCTTIHTVPEHRPFEPQTPPLKGENM